LDIENLGLAVPVIEKLQKARKGVIGMKLIGNCKFKNNS
jgi:hypothetical protein